MVRSKIVLLGLCLCLSACGKRSDAGTETNAAAASGDGIATAAAAIPAAGAPATAAFSVESVPLSNAPLGAFPEFALPTGYKMLNKPVTRTFDRIPFWTGTAFSQIEGKTYLVGIQGEQESSYNAYELKKNMAAIFTQIGAVKIFEGKVSREALESLAQEQRDNLQEHYAAPYNDDLVEIWIVRRSDKILWISFANGGASSHMIVVEEKPIAVTAKLLPADALQTALDTTGKAVIQVNFATDQAAILPDSRPQIAELTALLKASPTLRLAINGYTDETGSDAHNLALSDARARAVMTTLIAAGIDKARLEAKGFGKANPVSPNSDEAGKARNRRVELIKKP